MSRNWRLILSWKLPVITPIEKYVQNLPLKQYEDNPDYAGHCLDCGGRSYLNKYSVCPECWRIEDLDKYEKWVYDH